MSLNVGFTHVYSLKFFSDWGGGGGECVIMYHKIFKVENSKIWRKKKSYVKIINCWGKKKNEQKYPY